MTTSAFAFLHHSVMLKDVERLSAYETALRNSVRANDEVVDIGCGTGVLSAFAARLTRKPVTAIEYFESAAAVARKVLDASGCASVTVLRASSYEVQLSSPDLLVTETIGQLGPEENIVELCYDFVRRHPSLREIIPARLSLFAQFGSSAKAQAQLEELWKPYLDSSVHSLSFSDVRAELEAGLSGEWFYSDLSDFQPIGTAHRLTEYELGYSSSSAFESQLRCPVGAPLIHLFFKAELGPGNYLDSSFKSRTHWGHMWRSVPSGCAGVHIGYDPSSRQVHLEPLMAGAIDRVTA